MKNSIYIDTPKTTENSTNSLLFLCRFNYIYAFCKHSNVFWAEKSSKISLRSTQQNLLTKIF